MHVAIRADGGPEIGFGHLVRTGSLAERCLEGGHGVTYLTTTEGPAEDVCPDGVEVVGVPATTERSAVSDWIDRNDPDVVLADSYAVDEGYQRAVAAAARALAVVMDDDRFRIHADCLINGNVYADALDYEWTGEEPVWCLGTDYLLLRADIRRLAAEGPSFADPPRRALVTMGGSDVAGFTPAVVRAFDGVDVTVDVIVGPGFDDAGEIRRAADRTDATVRLLETPEDLAERMHRADLAVSAAGSTVYELLALGTPTIAIPQAENQVPVAEALADRDAVVHLPADGEAALPRTIGALVEDGDHRRRLVRNGRALVDGRGTDRVYRAIAALAG